MSAEPACHACGQPSVDGGWCARCQRPAAPLPCACGAPTTRDGWCPRCGAVGAARDPDVRTGIPPLVTGRSGRRWDRTALTFGPVGRVVLTVVVLGLPAPLIWYGSGGPDHIGQVFGWSAGVLWWIWMCPWALRDLWRDGRRRHRLSR